MKSYCNLQVVSIYYIIVVSIIWLFGVGGTVNEDKLCTWIQVFKFFISCVKTKILDS